MVTGISGMTATGDHELANNNHVKLSELQLIQSEFGAPLDQCYKIAVQFYKESEKAGELNISYEDRVKLMALSKQIRKGPSGETVEAAGWFDLVGNDVTRVWRELGGLPKEDAMASFVFLVDRVCPPFKNFISERIEPSIEEASELHELSSTQASAEHPQQQPNWQIFEDQRKQIQDALNAQTFHQFSAYAQQQFPGQPEQIICTH
ncbi:unnamed protein product [Caenorhabditis auriculariae]|uniref:ACB domain-containing protein n=1 Tax=Caenorhabditis auriculariae TaxID=2777116 RepID=A0A8S1HEQ0_9PELO|nr:unnamed protein product [Caenorhabditis auriculariae]